MPSILTKTIGTGKDYTTLTAFAGFLATVDLVTADQQIIAVIYENQTVSGGGLTLQPSTCDATHYVTFQPAPTLGVNDLNNSGACTYGSSGIEISVPVGQSMTFGGGTFYIGLRFNLQASTWTNNTYPPYGVGNGNSNWTFFSQCRFQIATSLGFGGGFGCFAVYDCLLIKTLVDGHPIFHSLGGGPLVLLRNTFAYTAGLTPGDGAVIDGALDQLQDNLFINCGGQPVSDAIGVSGSTPVEWQSFQIPAWQASMPSALGNVVLIVAKYTTNFTDTVLDGSNTANQLAALTHSTGLVVNTTSDFRPAGAVIGAANSVAISINDVRGNNRGSSPDVGAVQFTPAAPLSVVTAISGTVNGQAVTVSGTMTDSPSVGTVTLVGAGSTLTLGPNAATLGTNTYTKTFSGVLPGVYTPQVTMTNTGGTSQPVVTSNIIIIGIAGNPIAGSAPVGTGGTPSSTVQSLYLTGRILNASGTLDFQGDAAGSLQAFLDPQPSGSSIAITTGTRGTAMPNVTGTFWGIQTTLTGNAYKLRLVATANGQVATTISATFSISVASGAPQFPAAITTATLTFVSFSTLIPGATNTATYAFTYGAPSSITATKNAISLTISNITITTTSGSGVTAAGTTSFTFTNPAAETYAIIALGTGSRSSTAPTVSLITVSPTLTWAAFGVQLPNSDSGSALYTFSHGTPTGATATLDASGLTLNNLTITTTAGTGSSATGNLSFNFHTPSTGTHPLIVTSTGTFGAIAPTISLITANPSIVWVSFSSLVAKVANTAVYSFAAGAPSGVTISIGGTPLSTSGFLATVNSGSGGSAVGTISFTFTNPSPGAYTLIVQDSGSFASVSPVMTTMIVTAPVVPTLTWTSFSSAVAGATNTASYAYANGKPTGASALLIGASLSIASVTITGTSSGTLTFTFTNPLAGVYSLVAQGTGTNASVAASAPLITT